MPALFRLIRVKLLSLSFAVVLFGQGSRDLFASQASEIQIREFFAELILASDSSTPGSFERIRRRVLEMPAFEELLFDERSTQEILNSARLDLLVHPSPEQIEALDLARSTVRDALKIPSAQLSTEKTSAFRKAILSELPEEAFRPIGAAVDWMLREVQPSTLPSLQPLMSTRTLLGDHAISPEVKELVEYVLPRYFDQMAPVDKRRVIAALLRLPPGASSEKQIGVVLHQSGPAIQKLFQLIGQESPAPAIKAVSQELLTQIKPIPFEELDATLISELGADYSQRFEAFSKEPLAAASVGQVHRARLKGSGREVIVKVLRPGIRERAERETQTLATISAGHPVLEPLMKRLKQSLTSELDFRQEATALDRGEVYVDRPHGIAVVQRVREFQPSPSVVVMDLAQGTAIAKHPSSNALHKARAINAILDRWFEEAIFGGGFFHSDLHPGNIFLKIDGALPNGFLATLIDFGNVGELSFHQRRAFASLVVSVIIQDPNHILRELGRFGEIPEDKAALLSATWKKEFGKASNVRSNLMLVLTSATESGLDFPREFLDFNRGRIFLEKQLIAADQELAKLDPDRKLGRFSPHSTYRRVGLRNLGRDLWAEVQRGQKESLLGFTFFRGLLREYGLQALFKNAWSCVVTTLRGQ